MGSPLHQDKMRYALDDMVRGVSCVAYGDYAGCEQVSNEIASDPERASFMISTLMVALAARFKDEETLRDWASGVMGNVEFMDDVLDGIDDLPGEPQEDAFHE